MRALQYTLVAIILVVLSGCGANRTLPDCSALLDSADGVSEPSAPISKAGIALVTGKFSPEIVVDDRTFTVRTPRVAGINNPATGAAVGAVAGLGPCFFLGMIGGPLAFGGCASAVGAPLAVAGATAGAAAGTARALDPKVQKEVEDAEKKRKAQEEAAARSMYERAQAQQAISGITTPIDLNRTFVALVKNHMKSSGAGELPELSGQGPKSLTDQPKYQSTYPYVLELMLTEQGVEVTGTNVESRYAFGFAARGRLVRTADNAVIHIFTARHKTEFRDAVAWMADDAKLVKDEAEAALQVLAKTAANEWIASVAKRDSNVDGRIVIVYSHVGGLASAQISLDSCLVGSLPVYGWISFRASPGSHTVKSEKIFMPLSNYEFGDIKVNVKPGETVYLALEMRPFGGSWGERLFEVNREFAEEFIARYRKINPDTAIPPPTNRNLRQ